MLLALPALAAVILVAAVLWLAGAVFGLPLLLLQCFFRAMCSQSGLLLI
jgi:hypothetical protein